MRSARSALGPADLVTAAAASLLFPLVAVRLRLRGSSRITEPPSAPSPAEVPADVLARARRMARISEAVARRAPWNPNCLARALVLRRLLAWRGIHATLRIGARRASVDGTPSPDPAHGTRGAMEFHAWIELGGRVLNDRPDVGREFTAFEPANRTRSR